jgi:hypothetical protein
MALVKCKQCGGEVASNAAACPKCGAPPPRGKSKIALYVLGSFMGLCFFGTCVGMVSGSKGKTGTTATASPAAGSARQETAEEQKPAATQVEIRTLLGEYKDNEIRADSTFKGHIIQTTGVVGDVKKDILGSIYVTLGTGRQLEIPTVQCYFDDSHAAKAANLSKGSKVTVRGRVDGLMMNVLVKDCEFVD